MKETKPTKKVILGVAASDAHVIANHLIAHHLRESGYEVINLGACTAVHEFVAAAKAESNVHAILIGSLNGHAYEDLQPLSEAKRSGQVGCPVIIGGNLSVGSDKSRQDNSRFHDIGVDMILESYQELLPLLGSLELQSAGRRVS